MPECSPAPWPNRDGYVHHGAFFRQAVDLQVRLSGPIVPLSPKDFAAFIDRDVGNATDEPVAEVYPDEEDRTVTMLLDSKTAAVLLYAARLLFTNCEAHAREVRLAAGQLPEASYGRKNREEIAARQERIASRIRALDLAYRQAVDDATWGI